MNQPTPKPPDRSISDIIRETVIEDNPDYANLCVGKQMQLYETSMLIFQQANGRYLDYDVEKVMPDCQPCDGYDTCGKRMG